jgi:hypothetical protein
MPAQPAFEGTCGEVLSHSNELVGQHVRLFIVLEDEEPYLGDPADQRPSTGACFLLKYTDTWVATPYTIVQPKSVKHDLTEVLGHSYAT